MSHHTIRCHIQHHRRDHGRKASVPVWVLSVIVINNQSSEHNSWVQYIPSNYRYMPPLFSQPFCSLLSATATVSLPSFKRSIIIRSSLSESFWFLITKPSVQPRFGIPPSRRKRTSIRTLESTILSVSSQNLREKRKTSVEGPWGNDGRGECVVVCSMESFFFTMSNCPNSLTVSLDLGVSDCDVGYRRF